MLLLLGANMELLNEDKETFAFYGKNCIINYVATELQLKEEDIFQKETPQDIVVESKQV